ncbi:hypothetical protein C8Q75DRAFT_736015 [Abortiporus biennis]|nr:hypothetical protein C8Q75DRAFT_736015 [Abortiporus biennis]
MFCLLQSGQNILLRKVWVNQVEALDASTVPSSPAWPILHQCLLRVKVANLTTCNVEIVIIFPCEACLLSNVIIAGIIQYIHLKYEDKQRGQRSGTEANYLVVVISTQRSESNLLYSSRKQNLVDLGSFKTVSWSALSECRKMRDWNGVQKKSSCVRIIPTEFSPRVDGFILASHGAILFLKVVAGPFGRHGAFSAGLPSKLSFKIVNPVKRTLCNIHTNLSMPFVRRPIVNIQPLAGTDMQSSRLVLQFVEDSVYMNSTMSIEHASATLRLIYCMRVWGQFLLTKFHSECFEVIGLHGKVFYSSLMMRI